MKNEISKIINVIPEMTCRSQRGCDGTEFIHGGYTSSGNNRYTCTTCGYKQVEHDGRSKPRTRSNKKCKYCGSEKTILYGSTDYNSIRYLCKNIMCGKYFSYGEQYIPNPKK